MLLSMGLGDATEDTNPVNGPDGGTEVAGISTARFLAGNDNCRKE